MAVPDITPLSPPLGRKLPILVQVTVETTGTLLVGADIAAAATVVHALDVDALGLNCATGPQEMAEHRRKEAAKWAEVIKAANIQLD